MATTADQFANFAYSTLAGGGSGAGGALTATDTTLTVKTGDGAKYSATTGGSFMVQLGSALGAHELVKVTARTSDTFTIARAQEGTTAQPWALGTFVQQVATAGNWSHLWNRVQGVMFNVMDYGAKGDGVTDDTAAIQAAINDACAVTGTVFFPHGVYLVTGLTFNAYCQMVGEGISDESTNTGTRIKLANGANTYLLTSNAATNTFLSLRMAYMMLDANAGSQTAVSGCVNLTGPVSCLFERVAFYSYYDYGVKLNNISNGQFGHQNHFIACSFTHGSGGNGRGVLLNNCDENTFLACDFEYNSGYSIHDSAGLQIVHDCTFVSNSGVSVYQDAGKNNLTVEGSVFDSCTAACVYVNGDNAAISDNRFYLCTGDNIQINEYFGGATITGNSFLSSGNAGGTNSFINERPSYNSNNTSKGNIISGNAFQVNGSLASGGAVVLNNPYSRIALNPGYNPRGALAAPAIPVSGTAQTNTFEVDATVYVSGGTVTAVAINGTATGMTSGGFHVPAGASITLTYTAAPSWVWIGE